MAFGELPHLVARGVDPLPVAVAVGILEVRLHPHPRAAFGGLVDDQLRLPAHHLHRRCAPDQEGMVRQGVQGAPAGFVLGVAPIAAGLEGGDGGVVLLREAVKLLCRMAQPPKRHHPALAPLARLAQALLPRDEGWRFAGVLALQAPHQPPLLPGAGACGLAGLGGQLLQGLERVLPIRQRVARRADALGSHLAMQRAGLLACPLRCSVAELLRAAADDFATLRLHPLVAIGRSEVGQRQNALWVIAVTRLPVVAPNGAYGDAEPVNGRAVVPADVALVAPQPRGRGSLGQHAQVLVLGERFADAQQAVELPGRGELVAAHPSQQGQGKGPMRREQVALAGAHPFRRQCRLDGTACRLVITAQGGHQGVDAGLRRAGGLALQSGLWQVVEQGVGGIETALEDVDERQLGGVLGGIGGQFAASGDRGFGLLQGVDDFAEGAGDGLLAMGRRNLR